ncbi:NAD(P)H-quinone oxidoreductase subunit F [Chamaesiphon minutus]|uniref:NAD(P)H dehydrogenase, subunit NdhF3 family n=1 Tax=Chamaesiphon minutus (strain ATCC 27169 / PCC 6605) TaxID=1173020 RepID=K9UBE1_CHAP6|nr:NAD(P)H-quinone oxidoreductase subunit F [Chamaesiphon minutus]AFY91751.1 NAD(P)H dehydrogenase, subunit NdhF3 family [Chamaesiphon minutus PCC 6605]
MYDIVIQTAWLIPCYPLFGAILALPWSLGWSGELGTRPAGYVNILMAGIAFIHSVVSLVIGWDLPSQEISYSWLHTSTLDINFPIQVSAITLTAVSVVAGINFVSQIYSVGYLEMDWSWARFFSLMNCFGAGICGLVLSNSLFFTYVFLELLTLATYLLVGFWFAQSLVITGARDAFWTKRVGDIILLMGVIAIYPIAGTWNFTELATWSQTAKLDPTVALLLGLSLSAGPLGKCAQIPFQLWLDEAMEAPIPATVLRNAVVVGAGAFVLIKLSPVISLSPILLTTLVILGVSTAICCSLIAIAQVDMKRVLSYTLSAYIGLVFIAIGTQNLDSARFILFNESFGMSLLYMGIGAIIWTNVTQDLTQLGGLWSRRPFTGSALLVAIASFIALPPLGGFWGFLQLIDGLWLEQPWLVGVILIVNTLTSFSLTRLFCMIFLGKVKPMSERSVEPFWLISLPVITTAVFICHLPLMLRNLDLLPSWGALDTMFAPLLVWSSISGITISAVIYSVNAIPKPVKLPMPAIQNFFAYDFYVQRFYQLTIVLLVATSARITNWFDRYIVDGFVNIIGLGTLFGGQTLKYTTSGQSQFYVLVAFTGIILVGLMMGLFV